MWHFGEIEFDEVQGRLMVAGRAVELDRSSRAILSLLLQEAGADVSKERLLEAGWPNRIVHENSLAKAIGRLRLVLGDQGRFLEAVYGYGYRLNVDVHAPGTAEPAPATLAVDPAVETPDPNRRRWRIALFAALALIGAAGLAASILLSRPQPEPVAEYRMTPPITGDAPDAVGRLLWVDDHPQNNVYEERFFEEHRIAVHAVKSSADALRLLSMYDYDAVLSDMGRGEDRLAGIRLVEQMRARGDETPFIIYTVRADGASAQQAQRQHVAEAGAQGVVVTPQEVRSMVLRLFGNPAKRPLQ